MIRLLLISYWILKVGCVEIFTGFVAGQFQAQVWASNVSGARGMVVDDAGDVLVVARDSQQIVAFWEETTGEVNRATIVQNGGINHGIAIYGDHLYASSSSTVWRWTYKSGQRRQSTDAEIVVRNIDRNESGLNDGGHMTRSLAFNSKGTLYISVGSTSNVDIDSFRARIRSFGFGPSDTIPASGYDFTTDGIVFADGLRNEVGLAMDSQGRLWGVENGADNLIRSDLGDIHNENPAEELNLFDGPEGTNYGYPYCWTEYELHGKGMGRGSQWAWPSSVNDGIHTDSWCRNRTNNRPPELAMRAHSAPLGITFFDGANCGTTISPGFCAFGCQYIGHAFIAFHGSWDADVPVGYKVVRVQIPESYKPQGNYVLTSEVDILGNTDIQVTCAGDKRNACFRPVDTKFDKVGALLITSDATGEIIRVLQVAAPTPAPSPNSNIPADGGHGRAVVRCKTILTSLIVYTMLLFLH